MLGIYIAGIYQLEHNSDSLLMIISSITFSIVCILAYFVGKKQARLYLKDLKNYTDSLNNDDEILIDLNKFKKQISKSPNLWLFEAVFGIIALVCAFVI